MNHEGIPCEQGQEEYRPACWTDGGGTEWHPSYLGVYRRRDGKVTFFGSMTKGLEI